MKTVYFDEMHDETSKIGGEEHYGHSKLASLLRSLGYSPKKLLSYAELQEASDAVFVISFPMKEFSHDEVQSIHNFVENGGGLLLLGEWGKLSKPIRAINSITSSFGIRFNSDIVLDQKSNFKAHELPDTVVKDGSSLSKYIRVRAFERHDINKGIRELGYFSGCSMTHMVGAGSAKILFRSPLTSSREIFDSEPSKVETGGNFALSYALERGNGRIVCMGDHSLFTNALINVADNEQYAINVFKWLSKGEFDAKAEARHEAEEAVHAEEDDEESPSFPAKEAPKPNDESPAGPKGLTTVVFDEGHGETSKIEDGEPFGYHRISWFLKKKGYKVENFTGSDIRELLSEKQDIVLVISFPFRKFSEDEVKSLKEFVSGGGGLWLLGEWDAKMGRRNAVNSISRAFGVEFNQDTVVDPENIISADKHGSEITVDMPADTIEQARYITIKILRAHGITKGVKELHYMSGCSLGFKPETGVVAMGLSAETAFADLDGNARQDEGEEKENLCVFAIQEVGKGRVAYLGDHGLIMNNAIARADNRVFGYNVVRWLGKDIPEGAPRKK